MKTSSWLKYKLDTNSPQKAKRLDGVELSFSASELETFREVLVLFVCTLHEKLNAQKSIYFKFVDEKEHLVGHITNVLKRLVCPNIPDIMSMAVPRDSDRICFSLSPGEAALVWAAWASMLGVWVLLDTEGYPDDFPYDLFPPKAIWPKFIEGVLDLGPKIPGLQELCESIPR
jgi:hypothetical protein